MKTLSYLLCGILLLWVPLCFAQGTPQATISWWPNAEPDIAGYRVYQSTVSGNYATGPIYLMQPTTISVRVNLPQQRCTVRYFWTVTAFNVYGQESVKSVEVFKDIIGTQYWIGACNK